MRGDSANCPRPLAHIAGSPPHAWGQLTGAGGHLEPAGFTPTCVGTAAWGRLSRPTTWVHPHMRGDSETKAYRRCILAGSPPHAWGQQSKAPAAIGCLGFTPTCVGTAISIRMVAAYGEVHPHMRGDSVGMNLELLLTVGSPPHAWGQRCIPCRIRRRPGFTPTCVGTA